MRTLKKWMWWCISQTAEAFVKVMILLFGMMITILAVMRTVPRHFHRSRELSYANALIAKFNQGINRKLDRLYEGRVDTVDIVDRLIYLDIGAREGELPIVSLNKAAFETIILVEGEQEEAAALKKRGYVVIDKFLSDQVKDDVFFHLPTNPGASSLKRPQGPFLDFYGGQHYYDIHADYEVIPVKTSTVDVELKKLRIDRVDLVKIDVQGSELDILNGMHCLSPIFWSIEIQHLPLYHDTPYGAEIIQELYSRGYIMFRDADKHFQEGCVVWSDALFMPNWTDTRGKDLIQRNLQRWKLLMKMYNQHYLLGYITKTLALENKCPVTQYPNPTRQA